MAMAASRPPPAGPSTLLSDGVATVLMDRLTATLVDLGIVNEVAASLAATVAVSQAMRVATSGLGNADDAAATVQTRWRSKRRRATRRVTFEEPVDDVPPQVQAALASLQLMPRWRRAPPRPPPRSPPQPQPQQQSPRPPLLPSPRPPPPRPQSVTSTPETTSHPERLAALSAPLDRRIRPKFKSTIQPEQQLRKPLWKPSDNAPNIFGRVVYVPPDSAPDAPSVLEAVGQRAHVTLTSHRRPAPPAPTSPASAIAASRVSTSGALSTSERMKLVTWTPDGSPAPSPRARALYASARDSVERAKRQAKHWPSTLRRAPTRPTNGSPRRSSEGSPRAHSVPHRKAPVLVPTYTSRTAPYHQPAEPTAFREIFVPANLFDRVYGGDHKWMALAPSWASLTMPKSNPENSSPPAQRAQPPAGAAVAPVRGSRTPHRLKLNRSTPECGAPAPAEEAALAELAARSKELASAEAELARAKETTARADSEEHAAAADEAEPRFLARVVNEAPTTGGEACFSVRIPEAEPENRYMARILEAAAPADGEPRFSVCIAAVELGQEEHVAHIPIHSALAAPGPTHGLMGAGRIVLIFGEYCKKLSAAVAARSGGTVFDLPSLSRMAEEELTEEGEALLATQASGALPNLKEHVVPLLKRAMASCNPPFVLNGYPRMGTQLRDLEAAVGEISLSVLAGPADSSVDGNLQKWHAAADRAVYCAAGCEQADVMGVLRAMRGALMEVELAAESETRYMARIVEATPGTPGRFNVRICPASGLTSGGDALECGAADAEPRFVAKIVEADAPPGGQDPSFRVSILPGEACDIRSEGEPEKASHSFVSRRSEQSSISE